MEQDFKALEKVQHRVTKLVHGLKQLSYEEWLKKLSIRSMKCLVQHGDLIKNFKILTGKVAVDQHNFFEKNQDQRTRGRQLKLNQRNHPQSSFLGTLFKKCDSKFQKRVGIVVVPSIQTVNYLVNFDE